MRRQVAFSFVVCAASLITIAAVAGPARAAAITSRGAVLAKLDDAWSKDAATKDVDRVASYYADDAVAYPPNAPAAMGREAAKKVWAGYFAAPNFSISWKTTAADVAKSGDIGFTAGTYEDSYDGPDGKPVHEVGKYVCVWQKQKEGSWKAIHDTWNSDLK